MNENNNKNQLEDLYSDSGPVDIEAVISALKPYIRLERASNKAFFTELGNKLHAGTKILAFALSKKLLKLTDIIDSEYISAPEVASELMIKKGTVDPTFKTLRNKGLIMGKGGGYFIPNDRINLILSLIKEEG